MDLNLKNFQHFNKDEPNSLKALDTQRKRLTHIVKAAYGKLDNVSCCELLDRKMNDYFKTKKESQYAHKHQLERVLKQSNKLDNTLKFQSLLNTASLNMPKPLICTNEKNNCSVSENFDDGEFDEFNKAFKKEELQTLHNKFHTRNTNKSINCATNKMKTLDQQLKSSFQFKTAREELQIQSLKKSEGLENSNSNISTGQKRKLGSRRHINSKFVCPLLTNNEGSKENIDNDLSQEIDNHLKHIEPKMIELIKSEIMDCGPILKWDDIAGLAFAKTAIQEVVVWPMLRPDIFTGLRRPPKSILLFGPPGTGKTLIGKCVASQSKSTFFSISASSLTSKWVGDGEKMVRALFAVARVHQPAVIFIDEIDSLLSQRSDTEHESSRRIKTEFLIQLDGATTDSNERILVIGATNRPQELDEAARRRFVKRLYIPLPEFEGRLQLVRNLIFNEKNELNQEDLEEIAKLSEGYSGADIKILCSEASLGPIRSIDMNLIEHISSEDVRPLQKNDFNSAFSRVKSSVSEKDLESLVYWNETYGSGCGF